MDYPGGQYHLHVPFNSLFRTTQSFVNFEIVFHLFASSRNLNMRVFYNLR